MKATAIAFTWALIVASCAGQEWTSSEPPTAEESSEVERAVSDFKKADPGLEKFFDHSYGYVLFPGIGRGGLVIGAAHGTGWVYERGLLVGQASMTQVSVGAQAGGESYGEVLFFRDGDAMDEFKAGRLQLGAQASAVMAKSGAAATTGYDPHGYAIFIHSNGGAMAAASVGGQRISFEPLESSAPSAQ